MEALSGLDALHWEKAIQSELDSLQKNNIWILNTLCKDRKLVSSKWVFKIKYNPDGNISKYKAHLVAKGNT
jgi:hypothetical protein